MFIKEMDGKECSFESPPPPYDEIINNNNNHYDNQDSYYSAGYDHELNDEILINDEDKFKVERELYFRKQIEDNYPIKYILLDSIVLLAFNFAIIIIQIVAIEKNAALSHLASGIWCGIYNIFVIVLVLFTLKYRRPLIVSFATTLKLFGMIISFGGFIMVNSVAFYHYNCLAFSYYSPCYNKNMKPLHYAMIILGSPSVVQSLVFFIYFQFKLLGNSRSDFRSSIKSGPSSYSQPNIGLESDD